MKEDILNEIKNLLQEIINGNKDYLGYHVNRTKSVYHYEYCIMLSSNNIDINIISNMNNGICIRISETKTTYDFTLLKEIITYNQELYDLIVKVYHYYAVIYPKKQKEIEKKNSDEKCINMIKQM